MRDLDIRNKIKSSLLKKYYLDNNSKVVDEMNVGYGDARVDIAIINGALHGYEIKSERDTLYRLSSQLTAYTKTFDFLTIVTGANHLNQLEQILPDWCGIIKATYYKKSKEIKLTVVRKAQRNETVENLSVVQLLWKSECLELLNEIGIVKGLKSKPKAYLWKLLAETLNYKDLSYNVREKLKTREGWKSDNVLSQCGDYSQLSSM